MLQVVLQPACSHRPPDLLLLLLLPLALYGCGWTGACSCYCCCCCVIWQYWCVCVCVRVCGMWGGGTMPHFVVCERNGCGWLWLWVLLLLMWWWWHHYALLLPIFLTRLWTRKQPGSGATLIMTANLSCTVTSHTTAAYHSTPTLFLPPPSCASLPFSPSFPAHKACQYAPRMLSTPSFPFSPPFPSKSMAATIWEKENCIRQDGECFLGLSAVPH